MTDNPMIWILKPDGTVDGFCPCAIGSEPASLPDGFTWTRTAPQPPAPPVPVSVTRQQAWLALQAAGLWAGINGYIAGRMNVDPDTYIYWMTSEVFERAHPLIGQIGAMEGLTGAQIDALFIDAAAR